MSPIDVLVPTAGRPAALAVSLGGLLAQDVPLRIVVSDQTAQQPGYDAPEVAAVLRVLRLHGCEVELHHRPRRRGIAEQRAFLLSRTAADAVLSLDDDVLLAPGAVARMRDALDVLGCGFVGMAMQGLSHLPDVRPHEHAEFEEWTGPVRPERVRKGDPAWERWRLHNAANLVHLAAEAPAASASASASTSASTSGPGWRAYRVAWIAGCVLYRTSVLRAVGGFDFWHRLPPAQRGEDVVAQLRVLERAGGAGLLPSLAYHLELPTTMPDRSTDAYAEVLEVDDAGAVASTA